MKSDPNAIPEVCLRAAVPGSDHDLVLDPESEVEGSILCRRCGSRWVPTQQAQKLVGEIRADLERAEKLSRELLDSVTEALS